MAELKLGSYWKEQPRRRGILLDLFRTGEYQIPAGQSFCYDTFERDEVSKVFGYNTEALKALLKFSAANSQYIEAFFEDRSPHIEAYEAKVVEAWGEARESGINWIPEVSPLSKKEDFERGLAFMSTWGAFPPSDGGYETLETLVSLHPDFESPFTQFICGAYGRTTTNLNQGLRELKLLLEDPEVYNFRYGTGGARGIEDNLRVLRSAYAITNPAMRNFISIVEANPVVSEGHLLDIYVFGYDAVKSNIWDSIIEGGTTEEKGALMEYLNLESLITMIKIQKECSFLERTPNATGKYLEHMSLRLDGLRSIVDRLK